MDISEGNTGILETDRVLGAQRRTRNNRWRSGVLESSLIIWNISHASGVKMGFSLSHSLCLTCRFEIDK